MPRTIKVSHKRNSPKKELGVVGNIIPSGTLVNQAIIPSGSFPNEPATYGIIAHHQFPAAPTSANAIAGGWGNIADAKITYIADATAPTGDGRIMREALDIGELAGETIGNIWGFDSRGWATGQASEVYISYRVKLEDATFENQATGTKLWFFGVGQDNSSALNQMILFLDNDVGFRTSKSSWPLQLRTQGPAAGARNIDPNLSSGLLTCAIWHQVEVVMIINTISPSVLNNGILKIWIDGVQSHEYTNVRYRTDVYPYGFFQINNRLVWGGNDGSTKQKNDAVLVDEVYISGLDL